MAENLIPPPTGQKCSYPQPTPGAGTSVHLHTGLTRSWHFVLAAHTHVEHRVCAERQLRFKKIQWGRTVCDDQVWGLAGHAILTGPDLHRTGLFYTPFYSHLCLSLLLHIPHRSLQFCEFPHLSKFRSPWLSLTSAKSRLISLDVIPVVS